MLSIYGSQPSGGKGNADWAFPLELSGVVDSFDASLASSLTISDTDKVDEWRSKNNGYRLGGTSTRRPSFVGTGNACAVVFSGAEGCMGDGLTGEAETAPLTEDCRAVIAVLSAVSGFAVEASDDGSLVCGGYFDDPSVIESIALCGTHDGQALTARVADVNMDAAGTVDHVGIDAVLEAGDAFTGYSPYPDTVGKHLFYLDFAKTTGTFSVDGLGFYNGGGNNAVGYAIHEIIICDAVPSETVRQKLEGYLAWKWGIEANLPVDHPYKAAAPTS